MIRTYHDMMMVDADLLTYGDQWMITVKPSAFRKHFITVNLITPVSERYRRARFAAAVYAKSEIIHDFYDGAKHRPFD